jgi:hypothetical protein
MVTLRDNDIRCVVRIASADMGKWPPGQHARLRFDADAA